MIKQKKNLTTKLFTLFAMALFMIATSILSGCSLKQYVIQNLTNTFKIDRMIYTDNVYKYLDADRLLGEEIVFDDSVSMANLKSFGIYAMRTQDDPNTIDLIYDVNYNYSVSNGLKLNSFALGREYAVFAIGGNTVGGNIDIPGGAFVSNRYMFSNIAEYVKTNYTISCAFDGCDNLNEMDGNYYCGCSQYEDYTDYLTYEEAELAAEQFCPCINWNITEVEGTNPYTGEPATLYRLTKEAQCKCSPSADFLGLKKVAYGSTTTECEIDRYFNPIHFNELVLDGIDMQNIYTYNQQTIEDMQAEQSRYGYDISGYIDFTDYSHMFDSLPVKKISINNIKNFGIGEENTVKNLSYMFANCINLQTVDFGNLFDGIQPTDISNMFYNCPSLRYIDLSGLDTSQVTNMQNMFVNCNNEYTNKLRDACATFASWLMLPGFNKHITLDELLNPALQDGGIGNIDSEKNKLATKAMYLFEFITLGAIDVPVTYDEACAYLTEGEAISVVQLVDIVNATPNIATQLGLPAKDNGQLYTVQDIEDYFDNLVQQTYPHIRIGTAAEVEEMSKSQYNSYTDKYDLYADVTLNMMYVLNGAENPVNPGKFITVDQFVDYLIEQGAFNANIDKKTAKMIMLGDGIDAARQFGAYTLVPYNCVIAELTSAGAILTSVEAYTNALNNGSRQLSEIGLTAKADETPYKVSEIKTAIQYYYMTNYNCYVGTYEEIASKINDAIAHDVWLNSDSYYTKYQDVNINRFDSILSMMEGVYGKVLTFVEGLEYTPQNIWEQKALEAIKANAALTTLFNTSLERALTIGKALALKQFMMDNNYYTYFTFDEYACIKYGLFDVTTLDEAVAYLNNQSGEGTYTRESLMAAAVQDLKEQNADASYNTSFCVATDAEIAKSFVLKQSVKVDSTDKVLVLGGVDSKFVVKSGTNVKDMFKETFTQIVAPMLNSDVEIALPGSYNSDGSDVTILNKDTNNLIIINNQVVDTPDVDDNPTQSTPPTQPTLPNTTTPTKDNTLIIVILVLAAVIVMSWISFIVIDSIKKSKRQ